MNVGNIAIPNKKGQVVIPNLIRKELGITEEVVLKFSIWGPGMYVLPMTLSPKNTVFDDGMYLDILKRTRGAWGPETKEEKKIRLRRRKLELSASQKRKNAW